MPNHCYNSMQIDGDEAVIAEILEKHFPVGEDGSRNLDFNTIIPYPQRFLDQDKICEEHRKANPNDWSVKDGFNSGGYDWCVENWGTKWNAYDQNVEVWENLYIRAEYYTAWSPPRGILNALCEMYPDVKMTFAFEEAGMGFEGVYFNESGELVEDYYNGNSKRMLRGG